jgi:hypothetical protein
MPESSASTLPASENHSANHVEKRKRNAEAQAAFRARRAHYIATLEEAGLLHLLPQFCPTYAVQSPTLSRLPRLLKRRFKNLARKCGTCRSKMYISTWSSISARCISELSVGQQSQETIHRSFPQLFSSNPTLQVLLSGDPLSSTRAISLIITPETPTLARPSLAAPPVSILILAHSQYLLPTTPAVPRSSNAATLFSSTQH